MSLLFLIFVLALVVEWSSAKEVRVLNIAWLSNGTVLADVPSYTSSLWIPLAIKHFNERSNEVLPLRRLVPSTCNSTLTLVDGVHDDETSANVAMREFIARSSKADVLLGPVISRTTLPVAVGAAALNIPQMSFGASADELSNKIDYPTFFRIAPTDAQTGAAMANLFEHWSYKKIGMIYVNNQFGLTVKSALQNEARKRGIDVFSHEYENVLGPSLDNQALSALQTMKALRLNVIVYAAVKFEFIYALSKAARAIGWWKGKLFFSHVSLTDFGALTQEQILDTYRFLNGTLHIQSNVNLNNAGFRNMLRVWPTWNASDLNPYLPDKFKVPENFFKQGQEKLAGRGWAWAYDSVITLGIATCGTRSMLANLANVEFMGVSGRVKFVPQTQDRDPSAFFYTLDNLVVSEDLKSGGQPIVATLDESGVWNFTRPIFFNTGSNEPPRDTDPPLNEIDSIPFGAKIYGWIVSAIALLSSLAVLFYVIRHRKERIFVESQPSYLGLLATGCFFIGLSVIALTIESDAGCMLFPWFFSSGLTLAMASLAVKSARIAIYWRHRGEISRFKRVLGTIILPAGMWLILLIDLAILLAWQLTAPWVLTLIVLGTDESGFPLRSSLVCTSDNYAATVFIGVLIGYMVLIALVTGWVSFWVRNAPRRYHEAKMTALAGVTMFQVFLMATPAAFAVWSMALARFLVLSSMSFLLCMIILITMFAPKIFKVRFLGSMAAKTAATKTAKHNATGKSVTFKAQTEEVDVEQNISPGETVDTKRPVMNPLNLAPSSRAMGDWKLLILGIRSEHELERSDSESPPEHDHNDDDDDGNETPSPDYVRTQPASPSSFNNLPSSINNSTVNTNTNNQTTSAAADATTPINDETSNSQKESTNDAAVTLT